MKLLFGDPHLNLRLDSLQVVKLQISNPAEKLTI